MRMRRRTAGGEQEREEGGNEERHTVQLVDRRMRLGPPCIDPNRAHAQRLHVVCAPGPSKSAHQAHIKHPGWL